MASIVNQVYAVCRGLVNKLLALAVLVVLCLICGNTLAESLRPPIRGNTHATSKEIITALEVRLEILTRNPIMPPEVDPSLPYRELLRFLRELKALNEYEQDEDTELVKFKPKAN